MSLQKENNGARRGDKDKPEWSLIPWDAVLSVVKVLMYGSKRYEPRNWEKGMDWSRCYNSLQRHLYKWWEEGEDYDKESNLHHLWHVACNALFLVAYQLRDVGRDNRPKSLLYDAKVEKNKEEVRQEVLGTHQEGQVIS